MTLDQDAPAGTLADVGSALSAAKLAVPDGQMAMHVKVYSPYKVYFDSEALSLSGLNATGPFDILPHHHPFISLLEPCELIVRIPTGEPSHIRISGGIMHVKADQVQVFLQV